MSTEKRCPGCVQRLAKTIARGEGVDIPTASENQIKHYMYLGGLVFDEIMAIQEEGHE